MKRNHFILILTILILSIGVLLAGNYGQSYDDPGDAQYGEESLKAYRGSRDFLWQGDRIYYGPAFFMFSSAIVSLSDHARLNISEVDVRHFLNFLTFALGCISFYSIVRRVSKPLPAIAGTLLFSTQPLLFGHAFINQKDIPFMGFFLATVAVGFKAMDLLGESSNYVNRWRCVYIVEKFQDHLDKWRNNPGTLIVKVLLGLFILVVGIDLLLLNRIFLPIALRTIRHAYSGTSFAPINYLFNIIAQDAYKSPIDAYLNKITQFYDIFRFPALIIGSLLLITYAFNNSTDKLQRKRFYWLSPTLLLAAGLLGVTTSIRVAGPFAGALVMGYLIFGLRKRLLIPVIQYWLIAALVTYLTWPFLWGSPILRLTESISIMSDFPGHLVLYMGNQLSSRELPWHFLPILIAIQFTEPVLPLLGLGVFKSIRVARESAVRATLVILFAMWTGLPALAVMVFRTPIYGNFRQLLFSIPGLFIFVTLGIDFIYHRIQKRWIFILLISLLLIPGFIGIISLHPYEYSYYNSYIGGTSEAFGFFETDPWCTSYRAAMNKLNSFAAPGSQIAVWGPRFLAREFAREDFDIVDVGDNNPDYVLLCSRGVSSYSFYSDFEDLDQVSKGQAIFAIIKARPGGR